MIVLDDGAVVSVVSPQPPSVTAVQAPPLVTAVSVLDGLLPYVVDVTPPALASASGVLPVPGPPGPAGPSGDVYTHLQVSPAAVWTVHHGLGRQPVAAAVYSADYGTQWDGVTVQPLDASTCRLTFDDPTAGVALIT